MHRDIKSANICITSDFGAKLFVGGLGKVFAKDSVVQEAIARSGQLISVGGGGPLETLVYLDPCYEDNDCVYETVCDVFALASIFIFEI